MNRYLVGAMTAAVAGTLAVGCVKDPTESIRDNAPARLAVSNRYISVNVGDSLPVSVLVLDAQGNQLGDQVTVATLNAATVTTTSAPASTPIPQTNFFVKANAFGTGKIEVSLGSLKDTVIVNTFPATVRIAGQLDTLLRSGAPMQLTLEALATNGTAIVGVTPVTWTTSNAASATVDANGLVTGLAVGLADITVTVPGGTSKVSFQVVPGVPVSARFASAYGGVGANGTVKREVQVLDINGNQNRNISEVLSVSINSSNTGIATVLSQVIDTAQGGTRRQVFVTASSGSTAGTSDISASVTTSTGTFPVTPSTLTVLLPAIASTSLSGAQGGTVSITGSGLSATGFATVVLVDGKKLGNITVVNSGQVDAVMPSFATTGAYTVQVTVGGVPSNSGSWTETAGFDELEASNDDPATATPLAFPFAFTGAFEGEPEEDDFFTFTLTSPATLLIDMGFAPASKDLDILVLNSAATILRCSDGATGDNPEHSTCTLPAGTYLLYINDFTAFNDGDTTPATYTITGTVQ